MITQSRRKIPKFCTQFVKTPRIGWPTPIFLHSINTRNHWADSTTRDKLDWPADEPRARPRPTQPIPIKTHRDMTQTDLEPLAPQDALDWYLEHRRDSLRTATRRKHRSALGAFVEWTGEVGIDNLNDISGRQLMEFKTWRKTESDLTVVSLNGNLAILQRFLRFCENVDAVSEKVVDRVPLPNVPPDEEVDNWVPTDEAVKGIRSYFGQFEYASRRHAVFELIAEVGLRVGSWQWIWGTSIPMRWLSTSDIVPREPTCTERC